MQIQEIKAFIVAYSGLEKDALHVHGALLLYILAMVALRQTRRSRFPWLVVLAVELLNELADLHWQHRNDIGLRWDEALKDLWNTMLWPTVLLFIGRYTDLFQHRSRHSSRADGATSA